MQELARLCRRVGPVCTDLGHRGPACASAVRGPGRAWRTASRGMSRSYEDAVAALNNLQSNAAYIQEMKKRNLSLSEQAAKLVLTKDYLEMIGVDAKELSNLSVIHVAGTKGKGSTSAYCESILRKNGYCTGFFSSPHLISVRERIRINGRPISAKKFAMYFWHAYDTIYQKKDSGLAMPSYFIFLTVMAFRVFLEEKVDVAIIEVGIGGEFDSTNILQNVSVVGITSLGFDHTALLGNSLSSIAWQKAGILKPSALGYTVSGHTPEVITVLSERSIEKECPLRIAPPLDQYTWPDEESRLAVLSLFHTQQLNASLALQLTNAWMERNAESGNGQKKFIPTSLLSEASPFLVSSKSAAGILECRWPGRNQILNSDCGRMRYFLDGAHTPESMEACVDWYTKVRPSRSGLQHALIVNLTGDRDRLQVIQPLFACKFQKVIFSPNIANTSLPQGDSVNLRVSASNQMMQTQALLDLWVSMTHTGDQAGEMVNGSSPEPTKTYLVGSISEALHKLQDDGTEWTILVTGSLHLVGAALSLIDPDLEKSEKC